MGQALYEEADGLTELSEGSQNDAPYLGQGPEGLTDGRASLSSEGRICLCRLASVL